MCAAVSQVTRSGHQAAGELQFSVTGFNVQSVGVARDSILQAFTGTSGDIAGVANSGDMSPVSDSESSTRAVIQFVLCNFMPSVQLKHCSSVFRQLFVVQVWVYEDKDEQWKEFGPGLQATFEDEHSNGHGCSRWPGSTISQYKQEHTVNFRTQPMTYMVKCGDTIELSTVVERRVMHGEYLLN
jgi:hypothetical protein